MDYEIYRLSVKEWITGILIYTAAIGTVAYFFYKSIIVFFILLPGFAVFIRCYRKYLKDKRKKKLLYEFSESLMSVSVNLKAGYSIENAFLEACKDMKLFFGEDSLMAKEIMRIRKGLEINITLEDLIEDLAGRSKAREIEMFSEVLKSAKRNGGNITEVLINTASQIDMRICVDREIETLITEKKLELRIMESVPFLIIGYLSLTSEGYFDPLYENLAGRIFMTACLGIYILAVLIGKKIIKIEI